MTLFLRQMPQICGIPKILYAATCCWITMMKISPFAVFSRFVDWSHRGLTLGEIFPLLFLLLKQSATILFKAGASESKAQGKKYENTNTSWDTWTLWSWKWNLLWIFHSEVTWSPTQRISRQQSFGGILLSITLLCILTELKTYLLTVQRVRWTFSSCKK